MLDLKHSPTGLTKHQCTCGMTTKTQGAEQDYNTAAEQDYVMNQHSFYSQPSSLGTWKSLYDDQGQHVFGGLTQSQSRP